jgi:hypothetical protein
MAGRKKKKTVIIETPNQARIDSGNATSSAKRVHVDDDDDNQQVESRDEAEAATSKPLKKKKHTKKAKPTLGQYQAAQVARNKPKADAQSMP